MYLIFICFIVLYIGSLHLEHQSLGRVLLSASIHLTQLLCWGICLSYFLWRLLSLAICLYSTLTKGSPFLREFCSRALASLYSSISLCKYISLRKYVFFTLFEGRSFTILSKFRKLYLVSVQSTKHPLKSYFSSVALDLNLLRRYLLGLQPIILFAFRSVKQLVGHL